MDTFQLGDVRRVAVRASSAVNRMTRINTAPPQNFGTVPTILYPGTDETGAQQINAVFGLPAY